MKIKFSSFIKQGLALAAGVVLLASCNKDVADAVPVKPAAPTGQSVYALLSGPNYTILKAAVDKAGLAATLSDSTAVYTVFAPTDQAFLAAFAALGLPSNGLDYLTADKLNAILRYHVVGGQEVTTDTIARRFPNIQLPTLLSLAPPSASLPPGLRMPVFPSKNVNIFWLNNIPLQGPGVNASNGIVYPLGFVALPPSKLLWERIATDANMTWFKAAVQRADSAAKPTDSLQGFLKNAGANFTVFVPTDNAFKQVLTAQIAGALQAQGLPATTAQALATALIASYGTLIVSNPASIPDPPGIPALAGIGNKLAAVLTPTFAKGLVVYHLLGQRVFSVNMPTTATAFKTLLNSAVPSHPGIMVQATFGTGGVTSATVKGAANPTASNVLINPKPETGTSDQHYINGVLHEIDQLLLPQ